MRKNRTCAGITLLVLLTAIPQAVAYAQATTPEVVGVLDTAPGNIAVTPEGRIIVSTFGGYNPEWKIMELVAGELLPYPNEAWAKEPEQGSSVGVTSVLGLRSDRNGVLWLLDHGSRGREQSQLVAWDTRNKQLYKQILINPPFGGDGAFLNDLALSPDSRYVFVAVISDPAHILIINTESGAMRKVLVDHVSMHSEGIEVLLDGKALGNFNRAGEFEARQGGLNPITIDSQGEWLYYGAMTGASLYRVRVADLLDESLSDGELGTRVERYGDKAPSAGLTMDDGGNVYVTDVGSKGVGYTNAAGDFHLLFSDPRIEWPDGMAVGPDDYIYFNINQQNRGTDSHAVEGGAAAPFYIFRFPAVAPATVGR